MPPRYGQSRSCIEGVSHGRRSCVENTQCIRQVLNECMISFVPDGTFYRFRTRDPALKCWAIFLIKQLLLASCQAALVRPTTFRTFSVQCSSPGLTTTTRNPYSFPSISTPSESSTCKSMPKAGGYFEGRRGNLRPVSSRRCRSSLITPSTQMPYKNNQQRISIGVRAEEV